MSRLTELLSQVAKNDAALADDLRREVAALSSRRPFGLNFERHVPESIQLPNRRIRRGDKVVFRDASGADQQTWIVTGFEGNASKRKARLLLRVPADEPEVATAPLDDLVVVAEFRDAIYPGLRSTGVVARGGDKPFHAVINGENFHVLQALTFVCRGRVDCIYIDPPYNSGARDWKYNNDYVDAEDAYRHSKWLAMMERRLMLAKELLRPQNSVLIVTVDEHEVHRLRLLLEQTFSDAAVQMVTIVVNPKGVAQGGFARVEEYALYCFFGAAGVSATHDDLLSDAATQRNTRFWKGLLRAGTNARPSDGLGMVYPIFIDPERSRIVSVGKTLRERIERDEVAGDPNDWLPGPATDSECPEGTSLVWPLRKDGSLGVWQAVPNTLLSLAAEGFTKCVLRPEGWAISYVPSGIRSKIESDEISVRGYDEVSGSAVLDRNTDRARAKTVWKRARHDAGWHGSVVLRKLLNTRSFDFPKSIYAVRDALEPVIGNKQDALVVDFFAGSGTTAHAMALLNRADGGRRSSISVTNNEVGADYEKSLVEAGHKPGDPEWEQQGVFRSVTVPRIVAAVTGVRPDGEPVDLEYDDGSSAADGLPENVEFFDLTYEDPERVRHGLGFEAVAPLLWFRAGRDGTRIDSVDGPFAVADAYAVLFDLDAAAGFVGAVRAKPELRIAYIVTDDDTQFQVVAGQLPHSVESVRLYAAYLDNFRIQAGA